MNLIEVNDEIFDGNLLVRLLFIMIRFLRFFSILIFGERVLKRGKREMLIEMI